MSKSGRCEKLYPCFLFEFGADHLEPVLPEVLEGSDDSALPHAAFFPNGNQVTPHHAPEPLAPFLTILVEIVAWKAHPNLLVVTRHQKQILHRLLYIRAEKWFPICP